MRKFRGWHKDHGEAKKVIAFGDGSVEVIWIDRGYCSEVWPEGEPHEIVDAESKGWVIEESSELFDRDGVEIFEGDLVRLDDINELPYTMIIKLKDNGVIKGEKDSVIGQVLFHSGNFCFGVLLNGVIESRALGFIDKKNLVVVGRAKGE
jgi:hypothetical protein